MSILLSIARSWKILAPVLFSISGVWLMISCFIVSSWVHTSGKVVQLVEKHSGEDVYYCPVTVFRDAAGVEHTLRATGGSNPPRFPVDSTVSILYRAQQPDDGMIEDRVMLWIVPSLLITLSLFYGAAGFMICRQLEKKGGTKRNLTVPSNAIHLV
jgi:hypothetical protein